MDYLSEGVLHMLYERSLRGEPMSIKAEWVGQLVKGQIDHVHMLNQELAKTEGYLKSAEAKLAAAEAEIKKLTQGGK